MSHRNEPVDDPACWTGPDLLARDDWVHALSPDEVSELDDAVRVVAGRPLTDVVTGDFPLPVLGPRLAEIAKQVVNGVGVALVKNVPVDRYSENEARMALWGLGQHLGVAQPQDSEGNLLHDVRDTGERVEENPALRIYQTNARQTFHNDGGDMFALLCRRQAEEGGDSRLASVPALFNEILIRRPDLARVLQDPFHFDARGQQLPGRPEVQVLPVLHWSHGRLHAVHKRPYIEFAQRFDHVPRLSVEQTAALDLIDEICEDPAFHLSFRQQPGDIIIANNFVTLHDRTAFRDPPPPKERRHMIRLWLGVPGAPSVPEIFRHTREYGFLFDLPGRDPAFKPV